MSVEVAWRFLAPGDRRSVLPNMPLITPVCCRISPQCVCVRVVYWNRKVESFCCLSRKIGAVILVGWSFLSLTWRPGLPPIALGRGVKAVLPSLSQFGKVSVLRGTHDRLKRVFRQTAHSVPVLLSNTLVLYAVTDFSSGSRLNSRHSWHV